MREVYKDMPRRRLVRERYGSGSVLRPSARELSAINGTGRPTGIDRRLCQMPGRHALQYKLAAAD